MPATRTWLEEVSSKVNNVNDDSNNIMHTLQTLIFRTVVVFMVRGLVTDLHFPYALFPVKTLKGHELFSLLWRTIERLTLLDFKVHTITCDGAKCNRKMFALHSLANSTKDVTYKTPNIYTSGDIFFISDPPHLLKTARNCLESKKKERYG